MLAREEWSIPKVQPDVFSLESLIAWLEKQPAEQGYSYWNCKGSCLYGLYTNACGIEWRESGHFDAYGDNSPRSEFCEYVYEHVASSMPHIFGAALARARSALAASE
jgi:hypothetical protein